MKLSRHENFAVFFGQNYISRFRKNYEFSSILISRFEQKYGLRGSLISRSKEENKNNFMSRFFSYEYETIN